MEIETYVLAMCSNLAYGCASCHGVLYSQEYRYDDRFKSLVAGIVAEFIENYNPARERCWMAESNGQIVGSVFLVEKSKTVAKLRLLLRTFGAKWVGKILSQSATDLLCKHATRRYALRERLRRTQSSANSFRSYRSRTRVGP